MKLQRPVFLRLAILLLWAPLAFFACDDSGGKKSSISVNLTILQTTDMHNRAAGYGVHNDYSPDVTGDDSVLGGFARLATKTNDIRDARTAEDIPVLLLDSGDFTMGTVYDLLWDDDPTAFAYLQYMEYDAVTLGNHEFDYNPARLAAMITAAQGSIGGFDVPIVASNMEFDAGDPRDDDLVAHWNDAIVPHLVLDLANGMKVGIIGLMGETADTYAPNAAPVTFNSDYADAGVSAAIQAVVDNLKDVDEVDIVIALSHSGLTNVSSSTPAGDDVTLAQNVSGIDVILSGHEHQATNSVIQVRNATTGHVSHIVCAGSYTRNLLQLDLQVDMLSNRVSKARIVNHAINDGIAGDTAVMAMTGDWDSAVDVLLDPDYEIDEVIATTVPALSGPSSPGDNGLAKLLADSFRYAGTDTVAEEPTIAGCATGTIRSSYAAGQDISFADVFAMLPLGMTWMPDQDPLLPGYPLLKVYLTGEELYNMCGFNLYIMMNPAYSEFFMTLSGMRYTFDLTGPTGVYIYDWNDYSCSGSSSIILPDTTLYPVIIDSYVMAMLLSDTVQLLLAANGVSIVPKFSNGTTEVGFLNMHEARLDRDGVTGGVQEYQAWRAFADYLALGLSGEITTAAYGPGPSRISFAAAP